MAETNSNNVVTNLINNITSEYDFDSTDASDIIVIDSSDCRIGVKTYNPECEIHVSGGTIKTSYLDLSNGFVLSNLISDGSFNLGSHEKPWNIIYCVSGDFTDVSISPQTVFIGGQKALSLNTNQDLLLGNSSQNTNITQVNDISINGNLSVSQNIEISNTTSFNICKTFNINSISGEINNLDISNGTIDCSSLNNRLIQYNNDFINTIPEHTLGIDVSVNITNNSSNNFKLGFWEVLANRQHINKLKTIADNEWIDNGVHLIVDILSQTTTTNLTFYSSKSFFVKGNSSANNLVISSFNNITGKFNSSSINCVSGGFFIINNYDVTTIDISIT